MASNLCECIENQTKKVNDKVHAKRDEERKAGYFGIVRDREAEAFYCHAGDSGGTSVCTILRSWPQIRLIILGGCWYAFQTYFYMFLANLLVYATWNYLPQDDAAYPETATLNGTSFNHTALCGTSFNHTALTDLGFLITPDLSYRPWWLKAMFVDLNVILAQFLPPVLLCLSGQTKRFVVYVGCVGFVNIFKGIIQILTILPPANGGQNCWLKNFSQAQLDVAQTSFSWVFTKSWGMAHGCNDMLWSGHTAQTCIGFLFIISCLRRLGVSWCINVPIVLYFIGYVWSVLALRMHYSIDVLAATLIGCFVFTNSAWRQYMWMLANMIVCNDPWDESQGSEELQEDSDEEAEQ